MIVEQFWSCSSFFSRAIAILEALSPWRGGPADKSVNQNKIPFDLGAWLQNDRAMIWYQHQAPF